MGSLKIKSVDINILGRSSQASSVQQPISPTQHQHTTRTNPTASGQFSRPPAEKVVITTILSFDGLLLNFSIRQITSTESTTKMITDANISVAGAGQPVQIKTHNKRYSILDFSIKAFLKFEKKLAVFRLSKDNWAENLQLAFI